MKFLLGDGSTTISEEQKPGVSIKEENPIPSNIKEHKPTLRIYENTICEDHERNWRSARYSKSFILRMFHNKFGFEYPIFLKAEGARSMKVTSKSIDSCMATLW
ncbi:hypothetical protein B9Z55_022137 [Caenorhabditis nigoni]|nr:hypothetical protein B9Z55_022137 [Caenorhabditis nigoni]